MSIFYVWFLSFFRHVTAVVHNFPLNLYFSRRCLRVRQTSANSAQVETQTGDWFDRCLSTLGVDNVLVLMYSCSGDWYQQRSSLLKCWLRTSVIPTELGGKHYYYLSYSNTVNLQYLVERYFDTQNLYL